MNDLALIVINDGNGAQCGDNYRHRLCAARCDIPTRHLAWWRMVTTAERWRRAHDCEPSTIAQEREAVEELDAYYQRHIAELDAKE